MAKLVIDASVVSAWCFPDERTEYANAVLRAVAAGKAFAPRLWAYEVRNSLLTGLRRGRISRAHALDFLSSLQGLDIHLIDPVSYDEVFEIGRAHGLSSYDAAYLDLALREGASLASIDDALCAAAGEVGVTVFQPL